MYSVELLEKAVRDLYLSGVDRGEYSVGDVEHMLHGIDFIALTQAVRHKSETMYAYTADSKQPKSLNYRSGELFDQRAARLCADFDQCVSEAVMASRTVELWILEDMTITAVACVSVDFGSGAYRTKYREDKGDPWDSGMFLDLGKLTEELRSLSAGYTEGDQPYYEL